MRKSNGFSARQLTNSDLHPLLCGVALIFLMFIGRVGGLTMIYAALSGSKSSVARLPQERITVG